MAYSPYLIAPYKSGLQTDVAPWLISDDAFEVLTNAFITNKGTVKKKLGTKLKGRLQKQVTATTLTLDSGTTYTATLTTPVSPKFVDIWASGAKVTSDTTGNGTITASGVVASGTINYATGDLSVTFTAAATTPLAYYDYYPMSPVMGIGVREKDTANNEVTTIFDQTDAYEWNTTTSKFAMTSSATQLWTSADYDFFSTCNYYTKSGAKLFWATNNNTYNVSGGTIYQDGIKYYDGTNWATLRPLVDASTTYLEGCLIIIPFKGRLIALSTHEGSGPSRYYQRARWCGALEDPTGTDAWKSHVKGHGNYVDATTDEHITGAKAVGDNLIVYFERSIWKLSYTGIKEQPFTFVRISSEYGCDSPWSTVILRENAIAVGSKAITATNGRDVERIDNKVPYAALGFRNITQGKERVHGIRDAPNDLIYWTIPVSGGTYPEKLLVYNSENGSYSVFDDGFTALGHFQDATGEKWSTINEQWSDIGSTWSQVSNKAEYNDVIGGNQQGFISVLYKNSINDASIHITSMTTSTTYFTITSNNHNLRNGDYVRMSNLTGITAGYTADTVSYPITVTDVNTFVVAGDATITGTYTGGGTVSKMNNFEVITKKFNPLTKDGSQLKIGYVDLFLTATTGGQINVDVIVDDIASTSSNYIKTIDDLSTVHTYGPQPGGKYWQRAYINSRGQFLQLRFSLNNTQINTDAYLKGNFELNAMNLWIGKAGKQIGLK